MELISDEYDGVIIVGNGFDLNLGLKTGYCDFVKSKNFKKLVTENNLLASHLNEINTLHNWIDIENELKNYSQQLSNENNDFFNEFKKLSAALEDYLNKIKIPELNKESLAVKLLQSIKSRTVLILDFNYTNTISSISNHLDLGFYDEHSRIQHVKIHGSLKENNIIFGIEDGARVVPKHVFLKKSVNKNFNPINFSDAILNCSNFIVFGHSLGETDHMYFENYFRKSSTLSDRRESQNIGIYHFGENSYFDICAQIDELTLRKITKLKQQNKVEFYDTKNYS